jgi:hypothetical protein
VIEFIRIVLLLGIAGAAATFVASGAAWWRDEQRRLYRLARKVLDGAPDAMIVAVGRNAAAAFRLAGQQVLVMRDGGAQALLYQLYNLTGAELIVDDEVVARVSRDQPKRSLDQVAGGARQVTLRLLFDDPRHPDFNLDLWQPRDEFRNEQRSAAAVIREARAWLGRCEAIMRRAVAPQAAVTAVRPAAVQPEAVAEPLPWEGEDEFDEVELEEEDEEDFDPSETPRLL